MSQITVARLVIPDCQFSNVGNTRTGTCSVTNGSPTVTLSAALPNRWWNKGGYEISLNSVWYIVSTTSADGLTLTLTTNYAGSTNAALSYSLPPAVELRTYCNRTFSPSTGGVVQASPVGSSLFYKGTLCSIRQINNSRSTVIPLFTLDSTRDAPDPADRTATYSAVFYRLEGSLIGAYDSFTNFQVPATPTSTDWETIRRANRPAFVGAINNQSGYSASQIDRLLEQNGGIDATPEYLIKASATGASGEDSSVYEQSGTVVVDAPIAVQDAAEFISTTDLVGGIPSAAYASLPTTGRGQSSFYWDSTNKQVRHFNATSSQWVALNGNVFNVQDFGAIPDYVASTGSVNSSSTTFTAGSAVFAVTDVGKVIYISGAGSSGAMLKTTIAGYTSSTVVTLTASASTMVSGNAFYFGTDNTTAFQAAIDRAAVLGGKVIVPPGKYIITYVSMGKRVTLEGANRDAVNLYSAIGSGGIIRSIWPSNASTGVWVKVHGLTVTALDTRSIQYGFHDNCGSFVWLQDVGFRGAHHSIVFDQTEVSQIDHCDITSYEPNYRALHNGKIDPTNLGWTKIGSATTGTDSGLWQINTTGSNAASYYYRTTGTDMFLKGAMMQGKGVSVAAADNAGTDDAKIWRMDDGTSRFDVRFTSSTVQVNAGTAYATSSSSFICVVVVAGGATASLYVDGVLKQSSIAALSTAGSTLVGFGDFATNDDANVYYGSLVFASASQFPTGLWMVNGEDVTVGNSGGYTNVIQVENNQFNGNFVHIADDGGTDHNFAKNNMNGGLWSVAMTGTVNADFYKNAHEAHQWEAFVTTVFKANGTGTGAAPVGTLLNNNTFNNAAVGSKLPPVRLTAGDVFSLQANLYTKGPGAGHCVDVEQGAVGRIFAPCESTDNGPDSLFGDTTRNLSGDANDLAIGPFDTMYVNPVSAARTITGFSGGKDRRQVLVVNNGSYDLILSHQSSSSSAANRMKTTAGFDITISPDQMALLSYDAIAARWRVSLLQ